MDKLGIDGKILLAQIVNFAVLLFLFSRYVYKPFLKKLKDEDHKKREVDTTLSSLTKKEEELNKTTLRLQTEYEVKTKELYSTMKKEAETLKKETLSKAQKEADELRLRNKDLIDAEREKMLSSVKHEVFDIAEVLVEKATSHIMSDELHKKITADIVKKLPRIVHAKA